MCCGQIPVYDAANASFVRKLKGAQLPGGILAMLADVEESRDSKVTGVRRRAVGSTAVSSLADVRPCCCAARVARRPRLDRSPHRRPPMQGSAVHSKARCTRDVLRQQLFVCAERQRRLHCVGARPSSCVAGPEQLDHSPPPVVLTVNTWRVQAGSTVFSLEGHRDKITAVACSDRFAFTASADGYLMIWKFQVCSGAAARRTQRASRPHSIAFLCLCV